MFGPEPSGVQAAAAAPTSDTNNERRRMSNCELPRTPLEFCKSRNRTATPNQLRRTATTPSEAAIRIGLEDRDMRAVAFIAAVAPCPAPGAHPAGHAPSHWTDWPGWGLMIQSLQPLRASASQPSTANDDPEPASTLASASVPPNDPKRICLLPCRNCNSARNSTRHPHCIGCQP